MLKPPHSKRCRACPASSNFAKRLDCARVHRRFWFCANFNAKTQSRQGTKVRKEIPGGFASLRLCVEFPAPSESARGLAHSRTLRAVRESSANALRRGLRQPSAALGSARDLTQRRPDAQTPRRGAAKDFADGHPSLPYCAFVPPGQPEISPPRRGWNPAP